MLGPQLEVKVVLAIQGISSFHDLFENEESFFLFKFLFSCVLFQGILIGLNYQANGVAALYFCLYFKKILWE